jgi:hypothetical protein
MTELFVYYDPEYDPDCTSSFISENVSRIIVDFLTNKQFQRVDAVQLGQMMLSVVRQETDKVVIVFAQDVAPDTVLDDLAPTALVRQYLDRGGSAVWIGDIPFFYQAKKNGEDQDKNWWQKGGPANILGINPVFPVQVPRTSITRAGSKQGLSVPWTGIRPVLIDGEMKVLAKIGGVASFAYQSMPSISTWYSRLFDRFRGLTIGAQGANLGVEFGAPTQSAPASYLGTRKLANAWFKGFDRHNPHSGFVRIWDYRPAALSAKQLDDLHRVAIRLQ